MMANIEYECLPKRLPHARKTEGRSCNPKKTEGVESTTEQQEGKSKKEALAA
jgi:hypothetical protein